MANLVTSASSSFLAAITWIGAVVLLLLFIYVPTHTALTVGQSVVAWTTSAVVALASAVAVARAGSLRRRLAFGFIAAAPFLLATAVVVGLIRQ